MATVSGKRHDLQINLSLITWMSHLIWDYGGWKLTINELQEASTHRSAKTHAGNVFVAHDFDLWPLTL